MAATGILTDMAIVAVRGKPFEELGFFCGGGVVEGVMVGGSVLCDRMEVDVEVIVTMSIFFDEVKVEVGVEVEVADVDDCAEQLSFASGSCASSLKGISI